MMIVMEIDKHFVDENFICDVLRQGILDHSFMMTIAIIYYTLFPFPIRVVKT